MYNNLSISKKVRELANELKADHKLDYYQALDIALKVEKNEILSRAFVLSDSNSYPTALEKLILTIEEKS